MLAFWGEPTMSNGKGDKRRPLRISQEKFYDNWNKIFKKNKTSNKKKREKT